MMASIGDNWIFSNEVNSNPLKEKNNIAKIPDIRKLAIGPTIAIENSLWALFGSFEILATPPKIKRVILFTGIPYFWDMNEWDNSCSKIEKNKSTVEIMPKTQ